VLCLILLFVLFLRFISLTRLFEVFVGLQLTICQAVRCIQQKGGHSALIVAKVGLRQVPVVAIDGRLSCKERLGGFNKYIDACPQIIWCRLPLQRQKLRKEDCDDLGDRTSW